jgi:triphosphoribosyl-dephospho-CoA synthetase
LAKVVVFWIMLGGLAFAFALAVQMRMMIALVLRRALKAWNPACEDRAKANEAVMLAAASGVFEGDFDVETKAAAEHLRSTYPNPLSHLRTARRYSLVTPVLLIVVMAVGRAVLGVI